MTIRRVFLFLLASFGAALAFSAPHYVWEGAWEDYWCVETPDYTARRIPGGPPIIRSADGEPLAELPEDTLLLGDIDGRLYTASPGHRYVVDETGGERETLFLVVSVGSPTSYSLGIQEWVATLGIPRWIAASALSPDGELLALAFSAENEPSAELIVYELSSGFETARRTFNADTEQLRAGVECLAFSADGSTLYFNLHPHSAASDEFLDPQPLLAWSLPDDSLTKLTAPLGWVLPVAGRRGGDAVLLQEYVESPDGRFRYRWLELEPESGELSAAFRPSVNQGLGDPSGPALLLDGDPATGWTASADTVVDLELGRELYVVNVALIDAEGSVTGWVLNVDDVNRRRLDDDPVALDYESLTDEVRLIFPAGVGGTEITLRLALQARP